MTTQSSPDGQPPQTPSSGNPQAPTGGEEIRNWDDVRKLIDQRDELKGEMKQLRGLVEALGGKLETLGKPTPPEGEKPTPPANPLEQKLEQLASVVQGIVGDKQDQQKQARRKAITDTVIAAAKEDQRELVRGALSTLVLDGEVDIHAEKTQDEVDKALVKLRAKHPGAFAPSGNSSGVTGNQHDPIPAGLQLHELSRDQLARLSDEDFSKARKAARTSGLAV